MHFAILGCVAGLATESLRRAREHLVARSSTLEVVCLNVLAIAFGGPPDTMAFFDAVTDFGYVLLLNPLGFWLPAELDWAKALLSLWPSVVVLWAASRDQEAGRGVRLFLMWWVQLMYVTWVFPASFEMLLHLGEVTRYFYLDLLLATIGLVRVLLTLLALHVSLWGAKKDDAYRLPEGVTAKSALRSQLADGMAILPLPAWVYAIAGLAAYLLSNVVQHHLPSDVAVTTGFFVLLGATSLAQAWRPRHAPSMRGVAHPLFAAAVLFPGLLVLRELPLLPLHSASAAAPSARAPAKAPRTRSRPGADRLAAAPSERFVDLTLTRLPNDETLACELAQAEELRVRCAGEDWSLASLPHPRHVAVPTEVDLPLARYSIEFLDFDVRCVELPLPSPTLELDQVMLLVFLSSASLPGQVGWVVDSGAACRDLRVSVPAGVDPAVPTFMMPMRLQDGSGDRLSMVLVVKLHAHPIVESSVDFETGGASQ